MLTFLIFKDGKLVENFELDEDLYNFKDDLDQRIKGLITSHLKGNYTAKVKLSFNYEAPIIKWTMGR